MKVLKFGGTSVGSSDSIKEVIEIITDYKVQNIHVAMVSSAMTGITNKLLLIGQKASENDESYLEILKEIETFHFNTIKELLEVKYQSHTLASIKKMLNELEDLSHGVFLLKELSLRTTDLLLSFGERLSCYIINAYANQQALKTELLDARELVKTDARFGKGRVQMDVTLKNIQEYFNDHNQIQIITGFIGSTDKNETTTLGRGGSDYTASIFGAALDAEEIEIWTDVDGVLTTDPKQVKRAFSLSEMTYEEAMEMSHFGAKVIYPPTLQPAFQKKIPLRIRNTFNRDFPGTLIKSIADSGKYLVKGISSIRDISLINFQGSGMVGVTGVSSRLFGVLANNNINLILITQASSEHSICFAIDPKDGVLAKEVVEEEFSREIESGKIESLAIEEQMSIVAIIGENMANTPGISGKLFNALGKNGVNVAAIAQGSSERNVSIVIAQKDISKTLNTIHEVFFLSDVKTLNVFIIGVGLIGGTLIDQIANHNQKLEKDHALKINIVGMTNSKKMIFSEEGLYLENWKDSLITKGDPSTISGFIDKMIKLNLQNSVFIDCTSSSEVVNGYEHVLKQSVSITTPNKLASSGDLELFRKLKSLALKNDVKFVYETNVGAGLPVITTLNDLKISGDKILKIEGVLSGTLSYIFNSFTEGTKFSEVVKLAKEKGFTEPDPRDDLNGMDVARKILILSREVGLDLCLEDVVINNILPQSCIDAKSVDGFFIELEKVNDYFDELRIEAEKSGKVLRFVAKMENGLASVGLESVDQTNPFYGLDGSDNMISFTTDRYLERPLVIKGPGAGAEVTAAGVFAEIISISHFLG
ncbi:MAG: bifunctional aspartate kinase/homoserine dehydrogenase I [Cyclobacteriaceae bacterium]|nr:bifunctional aspartate kinase/homoserine dehydrogenase I [Cyclobacteriaceae bacterium]